MASVPLKYNLRNLLVRWRSNLMTTLSIALVVAVFIIVMSLSQGIKHAFNRTGEPLNIIVLRQGSQAETTSYLNQETFDILKFLPGVQKDSSGLPLATAEITVLMTLRKIDGINNTNVLIRGILPQSFSVHKQVKLVKGRFFREGMREVLVSNSLVKRFQNMKIGDTLRIGKGTWTVCGYFDASQSIFDSEVWGDIHEVRSDFDREEYSSALLRAENPDALKSLSKMISDNPRLKLKAQTETEFYREQTKSAVPIQIFGTFLAIVMSIGAVFAAINTMYASVISRTKEIGTLRVLGFSPIAILISFEFESMMLSTIGGLLGCLFSLPMDGIATSTANIETFSELAFNFRITSDLLVYGVIFSCIIGILGGVIPAFHAARCPVISALRDIE